MRCLKCYTVNPDGSIYCCKCGNKLPANETQNGCSGNGPAEITFSLCDLDFVFPPIYSTVSEVLGSLLEIAWNSYVDLKKVFSEKENSMDSAIRYSIPAFMDCFTQLADTLYGMLIKVALYKESFTHFINYFYACCNVENRLSPIIDAAEALNEYAQKLRSYRSAQRNSRGHWQGGGFGIGGAIRGAIKAGLLNAGSRAVYSICDGITDQRDMREYMELDINVYFQIRPSLILKQLFIDCCETACRLFVIELSHVPVLSDLRYDREEIDYLDRDYQVRKEIIDRFGISDNCEEYINYIDSFTARIEAYPFDLYPYWNHLTFTLDDFSVVEPAIKALKIAPLHRMKYDMMLIETGYKLSNKKYSSLDELNDAINTLKWYRTSEYYDSSYDPTIAMLERKRSDFM